MKMRLVPVIAGCTDPFAAEIRNHPVQVHQKCKKMVETSRTKIC